MADWMLVFYVMFSPMDYATPVYVPPVIVEDFQSKRLCEQAADKISEKVQPKQFDCIEIKKRDDLY